MQNQVSVEKVDMREVFNEYQRRALSTAVYPDIGENLHYPLFGLVGEVGEVVEVVKRAIRDKNYLLDMSDHRQLHKELGDVLWYVAMVAFELGIPLGDIAELNLRKLQQRLKNNTLHGAGGER